MTRNEIIDQVSKDKSYIEFCKKVCSGKDIHKDLYQYVMLTILEMDGAKIEDIHNRVGIKAYIFGIIYKSIKGNRSSFQAEYEGKLNLEDIDYKNFVFTDDEEDPALEHLDKFDEALSKECNACIMKGVYPAQVRIYEIYEQTGSYKTVSQDTRIPYKTVRRYVHETREKILNTLNDKDSSSNPA